MQACFAGGMPAKSLSESPRIFCSCSQGAMLLHTVPVLVLPGLKVTKCAGRCLMPARWFAADLLLQTQHSSFSQSRQYANLSYSEFSCHTQQLHSGVQEPIWQSARRLNSGWTSLGQGLALLGLWNCLFAANWVDRLKSSIIIPSAITS